MQSLVSIKVKRKDKMLGSLSNFFVCYETLENVDPLSIRKRNPTEMRRCMLLL